MNGTASSFKRLRVNFRSSLVIFVVVFALARLLTVHASARVQDLDDVTLAGIVRDQDGAVVPGASVTARLDATGAERACLTDGEGRYRLVELRPGAYALRVERAGFATAEGGEVRTLAGQTVRLDFTLRPASVAAEQTVVGGLDAPLVDATRTVTGGTVTREELERLPLFSNAPLDFVFLLGGVTEEPLSVRDAAEDRDASGGARRAADAPEEAGTFALAGGAAYSNNVTVDGLDNNDDCDLKHKDASWHPYASNRAWQDFASTSI